MRVTKKMLEERLSECRRARTILAQDNEVLKRELSFVSKLIPHASMIIAMEKMTDALAHTIQFLVKK